MEKTGYAYFIKRPRVLRDLIIPHLLELERPYKVAKTIRLRAIDYENFITDMLADRQFIEDYANLCEMGEHWKCILVQKCGSQDGVLVMPKDGCYVGYAAYFPGWSFVMSGMPEN